MKNYAADEKIGYPLKIDFRADWTHEFNPKAWELRPNFSSVPWKLCMGRARLTMGIPSGLIGILIPLRSIY